MRLVPRDAADGPDAVENRPSASIARLMGPFAALERFFERLFERPTARLFKTRLQPVQLQRRIERAIENGRLSSADRVFVPNRYVVRLNPADHDAFGELIPNLEAELAQAALTYARTHHYTLADRPDVRLRPDPVVPLGDPIVQGRFVDMDGVRDAPRPTQASDVAAGLAGFAGRVAAHRPGHRPEPQPEDQPRRPAPAESAVAFPQGHEVTRTMVFQVTRAEQPVAILREFGPDGSQREIVLDGRPMTVGRASDNGIVVRDSRVSRYHGRLQGRQGALIYADLGSTNGSKVNGIAVDEVVLGEGDRIEIGDTVLVVESTPDD
jgi:hypothetical protein